MRTPACFTDSETRPIIEELCRKNRIDIQILTDLCEIVQKFSGSGRKEGVTNEIATCIDSFIARSHSDK